jgi:hypothetical protein
MSKMGDVYLERIEIAQGRSEAAKIREFGSVRAAHAWLEHEERMKQLSERVDPGTAGRVSDNRQHELWRADQIAEGYEPK